MLNYAIRPTLSPSQSVRWLFGASKWRDGPDVKPTLDFIKQKLADLIQGRTIDSSKPPPIDIHCHHLLKVINFLVFDYR